MVRYHLVSQEKFLVVILFLIIKKEMSHHEPYLMGEIMDIEHLLKQYELGQIRYIKKDQIFICNGDVFSLIII